MESNENTCQSIGPCIFIIKPFTGQVVVLAEQQYWLSDWTFLYLTDGWLTRLFVNGGEITCT